MPVSDGEVGEIYVGGQCLAAGYLNRPDLTRSQFMELSLGGEDGRWYKSGDLARAASDGSLHYAGRADDQVKVRGFRIEPAEIETALAGVSGVHAVAVVAQEDVIGEPKLVAFYVSDESSENALRNHALRLLPSQMVPARFIRVRELPLSPAGKIDRRRLTATPLNLRSGESIAFETSA